MGLSHRMPRLVWLVWTFGVLGYVVAVINRTSLSTLGEIAQHHFHIEATALSIFVFTQIMVYSLCQIPVGILLDRFGAIKVMTGGLLIMATGQTAMAFAPDMLWAVIARVCLGIGDAGIFISLIRIVGEWFPVRMLPIMGQLTGLIGQAGQLVAVVPLATLVITQGWTVGFLTLAIVSLLSLTTIVCLVQNKPGEQTILQQLLKRPARQLTISDGPGASKGGFGDLAPVTEAIPVFGPEGSGVKLALRQLLRRPGVRLGFWIHFVTASSLHSFLLLWGAPFLMGGMMLDRQTASFVLSLAVLSTMIGGLVLGPIASRWAHHRINIVLGVVAAIVICWSTVLLLPEPAPVWLLSVLAIVTALGGPTSMIAFDVVRTHTHTNQLGIGTGIINSGAFVAALLIIIGIGLLLDLQGAGTPHTYSTEAFKLAMCCQYVIWTLGITMILIELPKAKRQIRKRRTQR